MSATGPLVDPFLLLRLLLPGGLPLSLGLMPYLSFCPIFANEETTFLRLFC